jgi:hypothetical protein
VCVCVLLWEWCEGLFKYYCIYGKPMGNFLALVSLMSGLGCVIVVAHPHLCVCIMDGCYSGNGVKVSSKI